jgi:assimilatory nitrate reductase catalytic subunit
MSRSGRAPTLAAHSPEPYVELHAQDALAWGLREGALARVATRWGACVLRVKCGGVPREQLFVPIHWNGQTASDARVGALVNPAVDPISGEPEFKHTPARIEPFAVDWHGFLLTREPPAEFAPPVVWWTRISGRQFTRYELAGRGAPPDWSEWSRTLLGADGDPVELHDAEAGVFRAARLRRGRIERCLFLSPRTDDLPARHWLASLFQQGALPPGDRAALLAGAPPDAASDPGATVCACFGVGRNTIQRGIDGGLRSVEALGTALKCGSNCGSCVPELRALLAAAKARAA